LFVAKPSIAVQDNGKAKITLQKIKVALGLGALLYNRKNYYLKYKAV
jgi:hypothetical protein